MEILIFKTDISNRWHTGVAQKLLSNLQGVIRSTIDVEDIDHVLRIEAENVPPKHVELLMKMGGYFCEELQDLQ
jgi:hypothetical protein